MRLIATEHELTFLDENGIVAGTYQFGDAFKPFLHPLRTPRGLVVSQATPHDHKHHKGLMYALRTEDVNFWEERSTQNDEKVGRQRHVKWNELLETGQRVGFEQTLVWETVDGRVQVFDEIRRVSCRQENSAFRWDWQTRLVSRHDCRLIQSQWSQRKADGSLVNYHGLGIRLARDLSMGSMLTVDGAPVARAEDAMGAIAREARWVGKMDPQWPKWPPDQVAVAMRQRAGQANAFYLRMQPFPFMSMGPSNLAPVDLRSGQVIEGSYEVIVEDALER